MERLEQDLFEKELREEKAEATYDKIMNNIGSSTWNNEYCNNAIQICNMFNTIPELSTVGFTIDTYYDDDIYEEDDDIKDDYQFIKNYYEGNLQNSLDDKYDSLYEDSYEDYEIEKCLEDVYATIYIYYTNQDVEYRMSVDDIVDLLHKHLSKEEFIKELLRKENQF